MESTQTIAAIAQPKGLDLWWVRQQVRWWNLLGQPSKATVVYQRAVSRWPTCGEVVEGLAFYWGQAQREADAIALLEVLVEREPERTNAWFNLGFLRQQHHGVGGTAQFGLDDKASSAYALRQATQLNPNHDRAWYGLALELIAAGQHDQAVPCLKACTRIQPMSPYAWYQLSRTYQALGHMDKAEEVLRHLQTFEPKIAGQLQRELQLPAHQAPQ